MHKKYMQARRQWAVVGHSLTDRLRVAPIRMILARGITGILSDTVETLLLLRPMIKPMSMFCLSWKSLSLPSTSYTYRKRISDSSISRMDLPIHGGR